MDTDLVLGIEGAVGIPDYRSWRVFGCAEKSHVEIMHETWFSFRHIDMRKLGGTNARAGFA
jgi:hypothetical protein